MKDQIKIVLALGLIIPLLCISFTGSNPPGFNEHMEFMQMKEDMKALKEKIDELEMELKKVKYAQ